MKKFGLLMLSIILFLISIFFLVGTIIFISKSDFDGVVIFGIPLIVFGWLFLLCLKKYMKLKNIVINLKEINLLNILNRYSKSLVLKVVDIILACFTYAMFISSISKDSEPHMLFLVVSIFFALLYILKSVINTKIDFKILRKKIIYCIIGIILLVLITLSCVYFKYLLGGYGAYKMFADLINSNGLTILNIIYSVLNGIFQTAVMAGLPLLAYISLILLIDNTVSYKESKEIIINFINGTNLFIYALFFITYFKEIISSTKLLLICIGVLIVFIINYLLNIFVNNKKQNNNN